jgi:D-glycero-alpha-D-manno-heptose 1-phosphate guanylyltransferase
MITTKPSNVAIILAGGLGTRLRPVISDRPKPMAPVGERPFLDYLIKDLLGQGFSQVILCVSYMRQTIMDYFAPRYGSLVKFVEEQEPLGTAGALKNAESLLPNRFAVLNGDSYIRLNYHNLSTFHEENNADFTITVSKAEGDRFGQVVMEGNQIIHFDEKNKASLSSITNAGVYLMEHKILDEIPRKTKYSLEHELIPSLISKRFRVMGFLTEEKFIDIGLPESYRFLLINQNIFS